MIESGLAAATLATLEELVSPQALPLNYEVTHSGLPLLTRADAITQLGTIGTPSSYSAAMRGDTLIVDVRPRTQAERDEDRSWSEINTFSEFLRGLAPRKIVEVRTKRVSVLLTATDFRRWREDHTILLPQEFSMDRADKRGRGLGADFVFIIGSPTSYVLVGNVVGD